MLLETLENINSDLYNNQIHLINFQKIPNGLEIVTSYFNKLIKPIYGNQNKAVDKIKMGNDRFCEILLFDNEPAGILVYKKNLVNKFKNIPFEASLEIKTLLLTNPSKFSGISLASKLVARAKQVAKKLGANNLIVTVSSSKPESIIFFLKKGFSVAKVFKNLYLQGKDEYLLVYKNLNKRHFIEKLDEKQIKEYPLKFKHCFDFRQNVIDFELNNNLAFHLLKYQPKQLKKHYAIFYPMLAYYNFINPKYYISINIEIILGIDYEGNTDLIALYLNNKNLEDYWNYLINLIKFKNVEKIDILCYTQNNVTAINDLKNAFPETKCEKLELYVQQNLKKHLPTLNNIQFEQYLEELIQYHLPKL